MWRIRDAITTARFREDTYDSRVNDRADSSVLSSPGSPHFAAIPIICAILTKGKEPAGTVA